MSSTADDTWDKPWTRAEDARARAVAHTIVARGMAMPAVLFFESMRPLHFISANFLHFVSPMTGLAVPRWDLEQLGSFLEHRGAVPFLIDEIQRLEAERDIAQRARKRAARLLKQGDAGPRRRGWRGFFSRSR